MDSTQVRVPAFPRSRGPGPFGPISSKGPGSKAVLAHRFIGPMQNPGSMSSMQDPSSMGPMQDPGSMSPTQDPGSMSPVQDPRSSQNLTAVRGKAPGVQETPWH